MSCKGQLLYIGYCWFNFIFYIVSRTHAKVLVCHQSLRMGDCSFTCGPVDGHLGLLHLQAIQAAAFLEILPLHPATDRCWIFYHLTKICLLYGCNHVTCCSSKILVESKFTGRSMILSEQSPLINILYCCCQVQKQSRMTHFHTLCPFYMSVVCACPK